MELAMATRLIVVAAALLLLLACRPTTGQQQAAPPAKPTVPSSLSPVNAAAPTSCGVGVPLSNPCPDTPAWPFGAPTKTSGCVMAKAADGAPLADAACTPGGVNSTLTKMILCASTFRTAPYRNVSQATKNAVYMAYGIATHQAGDYEIDHLVSLEDGGTNNIGNLWPQPANKLVTGSTSTPPPGFEEKDKVETLAHRDICSGNVDMTAEQRQLATDWTQLYHKAGAATLKSLVPKGHVGDSEGD